MRDQLGLSRFQMGCVLPPFQPHPPSEARRSVGFCPVSGGFLNFCPPGTKEDGTKPKGKRIIFLPWVPGYHRSKPLHE
jgi:hypothetical protein